MFSDSVLMEFCKKITQQLIQQLETQETTEKTIKLISFKSRKKIMRAFFFNQKEQISVTGTGYIKRFA